MVLLSCFWISSVHFNLCNSIWFHIINEKSHITKQVYKSALKRNQTMTLLASELWKRWENLTSREDALILYLVFWRRMEILSSFCREEVWHFSLHHIREIPIPWLSYFQNFVITAKFKLPYLESLWCLYSTGLPWEICKKKNDNTTFMYHWENTGSLSESL